MISRDRGHSDNISILLAENNQIQLQLLSGALRRHPNFYVSSCGAELQACLAQLESCHTDVVLLGGTDPEGPPPYDLLTRLHSSHPDVAIVLLLYSYDRKLVITALRSGARGLFNLSSLPFKALCRCIHAVHAGQFWVNMEQFAYIIEALLQLPALHVADANGRALLTAREEQVVTLVAEGLGNRQIARELKVSENTVKKALLRIFDKLGISNRVELVLYVLTQRSSNAQATASDSRVPPKSVKEGFRYESESHQLGSALIPVRTG